jgi:hypothetical protein
LLFGEKSPALGIDADLLHGTTAKSATFGSPPLHAPGPTAIRVSSKNGSTTSTGGGNNANQGLRGTAEAPPGDPAALSAKGAPIDFLVEGFEVVALVEDNGCKQASKQVDDGQWASHTNRCP